MKFRTLIQLCFITLFTFIIVCNSNYSLGVINNTEITFEPGVIEEPKSAYYSSVWTQNFESESIGEHPTGWTIYDDSSFCEIKVIAPSLCWNSNYINFCDHQVGYLTYGFLTNGFFKNVSDGRFIFNFSIYDDASSCYYDLILEDTSENDVITIRFQDIGTTGQMIVNGQVVNSLELGVIHNFEMQFSGGKFDVYLNDTQKLNNISYTQADIAKLRLLSQTGSTGGGLQFDNFNFEELLPDVPSAPLITDYSSISNNGTINLNWSLVDGATSYKIYRNNTNEIITLIGQTFLHETTNLYYIDEGLTNGSYYYVVTALNSSGESAISNCINISVMIFPPTPNTPLTPIINEIISPDFDGTFNISWNLVINATNYELYRDNKYITTISNNTLVYSGSNNSYMEINIANGVYYYCVIANNSEGISPNSNIVSIEVRKSTNGNWQNFEAGTNVAYGIEANKKWIELLFETTYNTQYKLTHYNTNPASTTLPENFSSVNYYEIRFFNDSCLPSSMAAALYLPNPDQLSTNIENLAIFKLEDGIWTKFDAFYEKNDRKFVISNISGSRVFALIDNYIPMNESSNDSSDSKSIETNFDQSLLNIPGFSIEMIFLFGSISFTFILIRNRRFFRNK